MSVAIAAALIALSLGLPLHVAFVLRPQIRELRRKMALPEFQGTAHQGTIRFALQRLERQGVRYRTAALLLALLGLGTALFFSRR